MTATAFISHAIPGRMRLKIPSKKGDQLYFEQLVERLADLESIDTIKVRALTGSLVISYSGDIRKTLQKRGIEEGWFVLKNSTAEARETIDKSSFSLPYAVYENVNNELRVMSQGLVDLPHLAFITLLLLAVRQLLRGQIAAPAVSLLWSAIQLVYLFRIKHNS